MRLPRALSLVARWLGRCGEACCAGRSQSVLARTLERRAPRQ